MPIYLPPISRREFLGRALAGASALLVSPGLLADSKQVDQDCWALLSDPHIAADRTFKMRGVNMADHLGGVCGELLSLTKRPAGVFITGDCAYGTGQTGDYALVTELLEPLRAAQMPIHLALGNHDHRERFWEVLKEEKAAKRPLADRQAALLGTTRANWFILDSLEQTASTPGLLGKEQLEWLADSLDANPKKPALVLIHHNPGISGNLGLKDTVALFDVIRPRKQVKAYIYGHTHAWKVEQDTSGIHLINLPPVGYVFKEGDPSGWVLATLAADSMRLELRCLNSSHKSHGKIHELKWRDA